MVLRKRTLKNIVLITPAYPSKVAPERGVFVENLVKDWNNIGLKVDIVSPISIPNFFRFYLRKKAKNFVISNDIVKPKYMTFSNKNFRSLNFFLLSKRQFVKAALKGVCSFRIPDLYYGKFLLNGGAAALAAGGNYSRPAFVECGESKLVEVLSEDGIQYSKNIIKSLSGVICVSERLKNEVIRLGANPKKVLLAPNSVETGIFKPLHKHECRTKLNLPTDAFLVSFVGHFIERKGPLRVLSAIDRFRQNVYGIFIGRGAQKPKGDKVLHADSVPHHEVPIWLNASDVFVLPTLAEGHCNAINEAIACGIPVITSDIADVSSQVPKGCGILIDPFDVDSLYNALNDLFKNQQKLREYADACKRETFMLFQENRGAKIYSWISSLLSN